MNDPTDEVPRRRWETLDHLRGLSVLAMLLSLTPGAWENQYGWLVHAKWEGWTLIDMVAPGFLVGVGAVMPLSLGRRIAGGAGKVTIHVHVLARALGMVLMGLFLNAYPAFNFAHLRLPGVLQRIGVAYALVGLLVLACRRGNTLDISAARMATAAGLILVSYWALLYFVPVPGYGARRFDPVGSWPAVIDRVLFTADHLFKWWPVDGKVVFDPDGVLSTYPTCALILLGVAVGVTWPRLARPALTAAAAGAVLMALAVCVGSFCPIVKNMAGLCITGPHLASRDIWGRYWPQLRRHLGPFAHAATIQSASTRAGGQLAT